MASTAAHRSTGWAVGIIAAIVVSKHINDHFHLWTIATLVFGYIGSTAPDWLENAWWSSKPGRQLWIKHRSWTHWGLAWFALLIISYLNLRAKPFAALSFGFAVGGLMHLIADWPNPLGVPWLLTKRYSLNLWTSGRGDVLVVTVIWCLAIWLADRAWLHGSITHHICLLMTSVMKALPRSHIDFLSIF
jgi:membrane-bound metal-dependent hydrolase YbcI (DUF457 family)